MKIEQEKAFERQTFPKGGLIVKEGELGDAVYLIIDGRVEIRLDHFGPAPKTLSTLSAGDVVGEMALFDDKPHSASVVAAEDTAVIVMSRDEFHRHVENMAPVMRGIMKLLIKRLRERTDDHRLKQEVNWSDWRRKE